MFAKASMLPVCLRVSGEVYEESEVRKVGRVRGWHLSPYLPSSLLHEVRLRFVMLFGRSLIFPESDE